MKIEASSGRVTKANKKGLKEKCTRIFFWSETLEDEVLLTLIYKAFVFGSSDALKGLAKLLEKRAAEVEEMVDRFELKERRNVQKPV